MQFTEDWFVYDDAIAMRTWLAEAFRTELFGPTFENSGPWQLMKSSRRDWIAPQASRGVSKESEQSSALMYDNPLRIRGTPHSRQSNSATEHTDTDKGVQEGTITPIIDGSPARSKTEKQLEMEGQRDSIQECAKEDEECKCSPGSFLRGFSSLSAINSATVHMDTHNGVEEGTMTPNTDGSPARSKNEKQLEIHQLKDLLSVCASNSATDYMDTHNSVQEGTISPNTDGSPARSMNEKQLEMEGHSAFIQKCAEEDEEWKWSPVYFLLRDFFDLRSHFPRPWKHTAEEWSLIQTLIQWKYSDFQLAFERSSIVVALQLTWRFHFSENITDVDLNTLSQRLEHVSQEKEFVSNLSRVQDLMRGQWDMESNDLEKLANYIAFFKAPSETPGHQDVMKRLCNHLRDNAAHAMVMPPYDPENFKDMWISRACAKNEQEMLIKRWKSRLFDSYLVLYEGGTVTLS